MKKEEGISLIVLVITIIVIIILAGAVILSLANNNPISQASEATFKSNVDGYNSELLMSLSNEYLNDHSFDPTIFNKSIWNGEDIGDTIKKYIPSITEADGIKFEIQGGVLVYVGTNETEQDWFNEIANNGFIVTGKLKSGNLDVNYDISKVVSDIESFGLNTINLPVIIDFDTFDDVNMTIDSDSLQKAKDLLTTLDGENINIILEPFPYLQNGTVSETNINPSDINTWFLNWKNVLKNLIDEILIPYNVYALNVSSNLVNLEYATGYWVDVIDYVRNNDGGNYGGNVTYRTNWWSTATWDTGPGSTTEAYNSKLNNAIFDAVDFISISAYFELNEDSVSSVEQLEQDIKSTRRYNREQNIYEEIKNFYDLWNKPIFFGELGVPHMEYASMEPWNPAPNGLENISAIAQANVFEAYKNVFGEENWFKGFSVFCIGSENSNYNLLNESEILIKNWVL
jgi:hypothetical protein